MLGRQRTSAVARRTRGQGAGSSPFEHAGNRIRPSPLWGKENEGRRPWLWPAPEAAHLSKSGAMRAIGERESSEAFAGFSPQSRVQPRQDKVFGAIVMPYCTLYRSNRSRFDSFNVRWVTLIGWDY